MIDLLSSTQVLLGEAGFTVRLTSFDKKATIAFEDEVVTGLVCIFATPESLIADWQSAELSLLKRFAHNLRQAGEKSWNVYCVFLCNATATEDQERPVRWIEEDLNRTRKIAACGIGTRDDLIRALLPLLPLQHQPSVEMDDATERLRSRIQAIVGVAHDVVLDGSVPAAEVVRSFGAPG